MGDQLTFATADQLIDVHGGNAIAVAQNAIGRFARRGDTAGQQIWQDVLAAIEELLLENERRDSLRRT
ncbi:MAG: hypothetical protein RID42_09970 [Alphaproteobacteria bacterium]|jgi:hypothetical protein